jgi:hypothetical protein
MLGTNDRFVFANGSCSFQGPRGQRITINERVSWSRPAAIVSLMICDLLAEYLQAQLACRIEVQHDQRGFTFIFREPPNLSIKREPSRFVITQAQIDMISMRADIAISPISTLLNRDGSEAIIWCLETLFATKFAYQADETELSWNPPTPKAREHTGEQPPVNPQDLALAKLVSGFGRKK